MAINLRNTLYKFSGKNDIASTYSAGNYSLSTLVQAVLPYSSSGMTTTDQANLVISCSNGNLSGEDIWGSGIVQTGYPKSQNISMGALSAFSGSTTGGGWNNYSGSTDLPTMTFKYVPYGWSYTQGDLYQECTTKVVDKRNYQSVNVNNSLPNQSGSTGLRLLSTASLESQMEFGGLIQGEGTTTSNAYFGPTLGNNQVVPPHSGSFKIPEVVYNNSNVNASQSVVFAFWIHQHTFQIYDTYIWANDQDKASSTWDSSGYACELTSSGRITMHRGAQSGGFSTNCSFTSASSITENAWNFIFIRMCGTNNNSDNDIWIYKPGRRGYAWVHSTFSTFQGTNAPVTYTNDGNFIFHPPFSHPSDAAIGHFYMFWETDTSGSDGKVTDAQRIQMAWVTDSGSNQLYTS